MVRVENFLSIFAKNGQSNLVLVLVLVLESKGPYLLLFTCKQEALVKIFKILKMNDIHGKKPSISQNRPKI